MTRRPRRTPLIAANRALPHAYGVDDIPVIVQDRSFDNSGDVGTANEQ